MFTVQKNLFCHCATHTHTDFCHCATHTHTGSLFIIVLTTEGFLEVAMKSWPEWDLNSRPLNSVYMKS